MRSPPRGSTPVYCLRRQVCFNLANQYHASGLYSEALNTYSVIVKNKQYAQSGRLRVNMGNIYYEQGKYPAAIKMYRMALDQARSPPPSPRPNQPHPSPSCQCNDAHGVQLDTNHRPGDQVPDPAQHRQRFRTARKVSGRAGCLRADHGAPARRADRLQLSALLFRTRGPRASAARLCQASVGAPARS